MDCCNLEYPLSQAMVFEAYQHRSCLVVSFYGEEGQNRHWQKAAPMPTANHIFTSRLHR